MWKPRPTWPRGNLRTKEDPWTTPPIFTPRPSPVDASVTRPSAAEIERVFGTDDRRRVDDVTAAPYAWTCALRVTAPDGRTLYGTGWLAGERLVVTAGHCVYLHDIKAWASSVEVLFGLAGDQVVDSARSTHLVSTDGWLADGGDAFDYGGVILGRRVGASLGYFAVASFTDAELQSRTVNVSGYPADRDRGTRLYTHGRRLIGATDTRINYDIDTFAGQSGSPVWTEYQSEYAVTGIHTIGDAASNSGLRITDEILSTIRRWKSER